MIAGLMEPLGLLLPVTFKTEGGKLVRDKFSFGFMLADISNMAVGLLLFFLYAAFKGRLTLGGKE